MRTTKIPPMEWKSFFDRFGSRHLGWLASIQVFGAEIGAQTASIGLPLKGIAADVKGIGEQVILITVGTEDGGRVTHSIRSPRTVSLVQTPEGADEALEIESADGVKTLFLFRTAALPELADCIEAW